MGCACGLVTPHARAHRPRFEDGQTRSRRGHDPRNGLIHQLHTFVHDTGLRNGVTYRALDVSYVNAVGSEGVVSRRRSRVEAARARKSAASAEPAPFVVVQAPSTSVVAHGAMAALRITFSGEWRRRRRSNRLLGLIPVAQERKEAVPVQASSSLRRVVGRRHIALRLCSWEPEGKWNRLCRIAAASLDRVAVWLGRGIRARRARSRRCEHEEDQSFRCAHLLGPKWGRVWGVVTGGPYVGMR